MPRPPDPHDIARLTRLTQRGGLVAIAVDESSGTVTGTGLIDVVGDRPAAGELAAAGVLAALVCGEDRLCPDFGVSGSGKRPDPGNRPTCPGGLVRTRMCRVSGGPSSLGQGAR